jgi:large subunit ribosomal protein L6
MKKEKSETTFSFFIPSEKAMSRIGKQPVPVPADVKVSVANGKVAVEGKKGKLEFAHHPAMTVKFDAAAKAITVTRPGDDRQNRALHGLTRALIFNMVEGVTKGYEKRLKIEGLGYSAKLDAKKAIVLTVGYANAITLKPPEGVTVEIGDKDGTIIIVKGADKQKVGQFAAEIRATRKPEPYKGKGIRYENEVVRRKEGKSFASGG